VEVAEDATPDAIADALRDSGSVVAAGVAVGGDAGAAIDLTKSVGELLDEVGDDPALARVVLDAESAKGDSARKTLVDKLEAIATPIEEA
jgi:uncharacterized protein (DUF2336 family)